MSKRYIIRWKYGIYGEGTKSKGIYKSKKRVLEDYEQCIFLQPENEYKIEEIEMKGGLK